MENSETDATRPDHDKGTLFVVSAPSGAGKTTLCRALRNFYPDIQYSVSHTTRKPRKGEKEGVDYHFLEKETFFDMRDRGCWAEWAKVHGHYYASSAKILDQALSGGDDILLDIDVQGAMQILKRYPDAVTIFVMAPSLDILKQRLAQRGTENIQTIEKRLQNAEKEISRKSKYRHLIVNDDLQTAIDQFIHIVGKYRNNRVHLSKNL